MKYWISCIYLLLFFNSCQQAGSTAQSIEVDIEDICSDFSLTTLFSSARVIPLETSDSSLFAYADKIIMYEDRLYIMDKRESLVMIFDKAGNFVNKIDKKGRGPEEYFWLTDICINNYEQTLELLDPSGKLLTYDLKGQFICATQLPNDIRAYHSLAVLNSDSILFSSDAEDYILSIYSRSQHKILNRFVKKSLSYFTSSFLYIYQDTVYYSQSLFDQVYSLNNSETRIAYEWFFPSCDYEPTEVIPNYEKGDFKESRKIFWNLPYMYNFQWQNTKYLYTMLKLPRTKQFVNIFHDKTTHRNLVFEKSKEGVLFYSNYMDDDVSINAIPAQDIETYRNLSILDEESRKFLENYDENFNPYLIEYKFKK